MELEAYLKSRLFTKKEFAKLIGVSVASISNYVAKKRRPAIHIANRIQKATDGKVTIEDLCK